MNDINPARAIRETWSWFPVAVVVTVCVMIIAGLITFIGWQMNWWFSAQNATRQAQITQNGYSNQTTLRQQIDNQFQTVNSITTQIAENANNPSMVAALKPQREASANMICFDAQEISGTPLPPQEGQWVAVNCLNGVVSPKSPLYTP